MSNDKTAQIRLSVYFSPDDIETLNRAARGADRKLSPYIRHVAVRAARIAIAVDNPPAGGAQAHGEPGPTATNSAAKGAENGRTVISKQPLFYRLATDPPDQIRNGDDELLPAERTAWVLGRLESESRR